MIQRIQTIFLALVVIIGIVSSFLPIMGLSGLEGDFIMNHYKTISVIDASILTKNMGVGVLQGLVLIVAIGMIVIFKNRSLQIKLGKLNILLISLEIAAIVMYSDLTKSAIGTNPEEVIVSLKLGVIIPVLSLILTYLAIRFIKKDEALVKSADRLR
ncbi:MAG: DUF4293 domain-containing protein [Flavobacteriales bacterium]